jgi:hypothetical protein
MRSPHMMQIYYYYYFDEHNNKRNLARPITGLFEYTLSPN